MEREEYAEEARMEADRHVDWLIELLVPILSRGAKEEFVHGFKHGVEFCHEKEIDGDG